MNFSAINYRLNAYLSALQTPSDNVVHQTLPKDASQISYKEYVLIFSFAVYIFETYLSYRQYRKFLEPNVPKPITDIISQDDFTKAQSYGADKARFGFVSGIYQQLEQTGFIVFNLLPWLWTLSGKWMLELGGYGPSYEITQSIIFFLTLSLVQTITGLPTSLYFTFVIEERHGFNKQTLRLFFTDLLKSHLLSGAIGVPVLAGFLYIVKRSGDQFFFWVWIFIILIQLLMLTIYPTWIQPLFNKVEPLPEGELRTAIESLASRIHYPLKKLFVIDGSKRSSHSNAYMYGFGKNKRIVLFDTLVDHSTTEEVCAVLAHELGHWSLSHTIKVLVVAQAHLLALFWLFGQFIGHSEMYTSFGFAPGVRPVLVGFILFTYVYSPVENLLGFLMNVYSRKNEFEADAFAQKLGYSGTLRTALIKLNVSNKGNMNLDPWYAAWNHSHPGLVERLSALEALDKAQEAKEKKSE